MPNAKITEQVTITEAVYPRTATAISSSTLVDMQGFGRYLAVAQHGTATTESSFVVTVWESTAATWAGAVATVLKTSTVTVGTASTTVSTIDVKESEITDGKRYIGVYMTKVDTASSLSALHVRGNDSYLP